MCTSSSSIHRSLSVEPLIIKPGKNLKWLEAQKKSKQIPRWEKGVDFDIERPVLFPTPDYTRFQSMSATDIFEKFIDTEIIEHFRGRN